MVPLGTWNPFSGPMLPRAEKDASHREGRCFPCLFFTRKGGALGVDSMGTLKSPGLTHSSIARHIFEMLNVCTLKMHTSPARQEMAVDRGIAAHTATFAAWHWILDTLCFLQAPQCDASEALLVKHAEGGISQLRYSKHVTCPLKKWMKKSLM